MISKRILCANDLTYASEPALRMALHLGRQLDVPVTVLHVAEAPYPRPKLLGSYSYSPSEIELMTGIACRAETAALRLLQEQVAAINQPGRDAVATEVLVRQGIPADAVCAVALELGADLLVVGTHARIGLKHFLLGSVAERLARTAPCPVLVARAKGGA